MAITREQVRHIALLARLELSDAEEEAFTEQLDHILSHFETLQQLDTSEVEPTAHIVNMETPFREDAVPRPRSLDRALHAVARDRTHARRFHCRNAEAVQGQLATRVDGAGNQRLAPRRLRSEEGDVLRRI